MTSRVSRPVYLLSPAYCGGKRARLLTGGRGEFDLAVRLRGAGAPIGEVFSFLSGLYFRGKLTYAIRFGRALVITPGRGLVDPEAIVTLADLRSMAQVEVTNDDPRFRETFERDVAALAATLAPDEPVVLLGSIATGKYVDLLDRLLAGRLRFPADFVGRGDMSRGGLLLRCVRRSTQLDYIALAGAKRTGKRPPRLGAER